MCEYLTPPRNGIYYFRRPIPERLRFAFGGKTELIYSLRTKDRAEAKRLVGLETVRTNGLIADAERQLAEHGPPPTADETDRKAREESRAQEQLAREIERAQIEAAARQARERRIDEQRPFAMAAAVRLSGSTERMPAEDAVVARMIRDADARADHWRQIAESQNANTGSWPSGEAEKGNVGIAAWTQPRSSNASAQASEKIEPIALSSLFDGKAATGTLSPAIVREWRSGLNKFIAFVGHDDATQIGARDILRWRNHLRDNGTGPGGKRLTPQRINAGYLAPIRATFKHGVNEGLLAENVALIVSKLTAAPQQLLRDKDYTKAEQRKILAATLDAPPPKLGEPRKRARRWVPWLCAYTGARVNEMTQLRGSDVQQIEGYWAITITPDAGRVKNRKARTVPIHEHLIDQGFLTMVEEAGEGPLFYDPSRRRSEGSRPQSKKTGEYLAAWIGKILDVPGLQPNHGWRHTFTTLAMEAGIDERVADFIKGHAGTGVSRRVYTHQHIPFLTEQLAKLPRFDVEPVP